MCKMWDAKQSVASRLENAVQLSTNYHFLIGLWVTGSFDEGLCVANIQLRRPIDVCLLLAFFCESDL